MYAKKDHLDHFLKVNCDKLHRSEFVEIFKTCVRCDSFMMALEIYFNNISHSDITLDILKRVLLSMRDSVKFHEQKLFFIHQHFDQLDIFTLHLLLDLLLQQLHRQEFRLIPALSQYNPIKYALLIYRITWRI